MSCFELREYIIFKLNLLKVENDFIWSCALGKKPVAKRKTGETVESPKKQRAARSKRRKVMYSDEDSDAEDEESQEDDEDDSWCALKSPLSLTCFSVGETLWH